MVYMSNYSFKYKFLGLQANEAKNLPLNPVEQRERMLLSCQEVHACIQNSKISKVNFHGTGSSSNANSPETRINQHDQFLLAIIIKQHGRVCRRMQFV